MKLSIKERAVPRKDRDDVWYIQDVLKYQRQELAWMRNFIDSALGSINMADKKIASGEFGYDDFGRSPDDDEYFAPSGKSVDDVLADLYDYDKTQEIYQLVSDYCDNIKRCIEVLGDTVINKD